MGNDECPLTLDDAGGVLGHAYFPDSSGTCREIHLDINERWYFGNNPNIPKNQTSFLMVLVHEIGHALGIAHSASPNAIMFAFYQHEIRGLDVDDINAVQYLYGRKNKYDSIPKSTTASAIPKTTTTIRSTTQKMALEVVRNGVHQRSINVRCQVAEEGVFECAVSECKLGNIIVVVLVVYRPPSALQSGTGNELDIEQPTVSRTLKLVLKVLWATEFCTPRRMSEILVIMTCLKTKRLTKCVLKFLVQERHKEINLFRSRYLVSCVPNNASKFEGDRTRNVVERQYGVWKRRFPILKLGMRLDVHTVMAIIVATAVLHNIAIEENEAISEEWIDHFEDEEINEQGDVRYDNRSGQVP
ncbi:unnamed protein product [Acanthoscelides obtectus]|uniref:Peptidase M10 metallopeptidase domain-containing protein n=1 Tax=Acanthoscelides obtectus TaxID=200917 RepID=A0A9P0MF65_ACAOB|nr:unnamed protein product [Acanthoscelides obtectus]CAK1627218.1 Putative metalloproteinase 165R [Acanthoscelides obtectus]